MGMIFNNLVEACVWLYSNGFRQNDAGEWLKGKNVADIRPSPANDDVVSVVLRPARA